MNLSDILEDIDLLAPNAFAAKKKINWVNQSQRQLYHDYPMLVTKQEIVLTPGNDTYPIPADCQQAKIETFLVGDFEYVYEEVSERPEYRTYTIIDGQFKIFPVPNQEGKAVLYYKPTPVDLTENDLEGVPAFPEDFQELLVFGGAYRVAQRNQDYKLATELELRYQSLAREAAKRLTKPKRKNTVIQRGWI